MGDIAKTAIVENRQFLEIGNDVVLVLSPRL